MNLLKNIWRQTTYSPSLRDGEIHVLRVDLNQPASILQKLFETLSPDEKEKAEKFRFDRDRCHFIAARGVLRKILAGHLGVEPASICFSYNRYGKPMLGEAEKNLRFNLSHSGGVALIAVTRDREIGVDVEFVKNDFSLLETAKNFFSEQEITAFEELPADLRVAAFFSIWTRKEAYMKALGLGFSFPPKRFSVSPVSKEEVLSSEEAGRICFWTLHALPFETNYKAAIAVEGSISEIRLWHWSEA